MLKFIRKCENVGSWVSAEQQNHLYLYDLVGRFSPDMVFNGAWKKHAGSWSEFFEHEELLEFFAVSATEYPETMETSKPIREVRIRVTDWAGIIKENPEKYLTHKNEKYREFAKSFLEEKEFDNGRSNRLSFKRD